MGIDQIGKNFVKSMSVKKFSYLGQFILGLRRSDLGGKKTLNQFQIQLLRTIHTGFEKVCN